MIDFSLLKPITSFSELNGKTIEQSYGGPAGDHEYECLIFTDGTYYLQRSDTGYEDSSLRIVDSGDSYFDDILRDINKP